MRTRGWVGASCLLTAAACGQVRGEPPKDDVAAVRAIAESLVEAWNRHDAATLAAMWAEDGDLMNPFGEHAKGREGVRALLEKGHAPDGVFRSTAIRLVGQDVRLVTADVAFCDWIISFGENQKAGRLEFRANGVLRKTGSIWLVVAARAERVFDRLWLADLIELGSPHDPLAARLRESAKANEPGPEARRISIDNVHALLLRFFARDVGIAKPWPSLSGKRLVLWTVAAGALRRDDYPILFSPADGTRSVEKAGGVGAYKAVTFDSLHSGADVDFDRFTSYVGRRNGERETEVTAEELERGAPLIADLSFADGVVIGYSNGATKWLSKAELGIPENAPITVGPSSPSPILKLFGDR